jgi:endoglucanase
MQERVSFTADWRNVVTEVIHINQLGFRPDDPVKEALLSVWLGTGGAHTYPEVTEFHLIDAGTGGTVFTGGVVQRLPYREKESNSLGVNTVQTTVYEMDFSDFKEEGIYRIAIEGIGCSKDFPISPGVWEGAFEIAMKGFYNQRSGIATEARYGGYEREINHKPGEVEGYEVFETTATLFDTGNGLSFQTSEMFTPLIEGKTDKTIDAWGGYFDAGDYDMRITHLEASRYQMYLFEMFPELAEKELSIPEAGNGLPDLLDETLYGLALYRRLQRESGGVGGGVEFEEHPVAGETSAQDSFTAFAYWPDHWSSYIYAATAAQWARCAKPYDETLSNEYMESAIRAFEWAEVEYDRRRPEIAGNRDKWDARQGSDDMRNLAALELYKLTLVNKYLDIFTETTKITSPNRLIFQWESHDQRDAAFSYMLMDESLRDAEAAGHIVNNLVDFADLSLRYQKGNAFYASTDTDRGKPLFVGHYAVPTVRNLILIHYITQDEKYLSGVIRGAYFNLGMNPSNKTYTTGIGDGPKHLLHLDTLNRGLTEMPVGITVFGNYDPAASSAYGAYWVFSVYGDRWTPALGKWPGSESFMDLSPSAMTSEFTTNGTMSPTAFAYGYLAYAPRG